jgi:hypothetical protein
MEKVDWMNFLDKFGDMIHSSEIFIKGEQFV